MLFILGDVGAPAKPAQDEPVTSPFQSSLLPLLVHLLLTGAGTVVPVTAGGKQSGSKAKTLTNKPTNNLAAIPVQGIHTPTVTGLLFFLLCFQ